MKIFKKLIALALVLVMTTALGAAAMAEGSDEPRNRYNVVFVTDESGSMEDTDPHNLRYEAIRRFVALMAQRGNYVGSVNFGSDIVAKQDVRAVTGFADKEVFAKALCIDAEPGWTNIGLGLQEAVRMLKKGANKDNPSVIILLTDGNTEMGDKEENQKSLDLKADAIDQARQEGYQIYTISLNTDGSADSEELKQIAQATGGKFQEVTSAEDLEEIQTMYYKMIFGIMEGDDAEDIVINDKGFAEKEFTVPGIGVEEFNVLLEGEIKNYSLTNAEGYTYTEDELKTMTMSGRDFVVLKVEKPVGGVWKVVVYGDNGAKINFRLLYNSDFYITTSVTPDGGYKQDQKVTFKATVCDRTGPISDPTRYEGFSAEIKLSINGQEKTEPMLLGSDGFYYDLVLADQGTYYAEITAKNDVCVASSDQTFRLDVDNQAPVASGETFTAHANLWPFVGGSASVDFANGATDPDGDPLVFTVDSSAFMPEDYTLDGTKLTVRNFSISKGSFDIRATDPYGAYCTFSVSMTSTNIGLIMAILVAVGILIALIVIILIIRKLTGTPFMGTITLEPFGDSISHAMPATLTPGRGRVPLESFGIGSCGLPAGSYFQAGGKDKHIYLICKKPVSSTILPTASKKIPIEGNGLEVQIYSAEDPSTGVTVIFESILNSI